MNEALVAGESPKKMEADRTAVMEVIRPLLLSPQSDQLAQDIAAAIEAVCQMAKTDRMRQHALQKELDRLSAKAAAAERGRTELEARVRQLQAACEANHADKARLQWLEQELEVQAQKAAMAEAALQDRAALEDRIQLLQAANDQQSSRHDEERASLLQHFEVERARLTRKVEHFNFEVLAKQREVDRLRQQLQLQQERRSGLGAGTRSDSQCSMQAQPNSTGRYRRGDSLQFSSGGRDPLTPPRVSDPRPYGLQGNQQQRNTPVLTQLDQEWEISLGGQGSTQHSRLGVAPGTGSRGAPMPETSGWQSFNPGSQQPAYPADSRQQQTEQLRTSSQHCPVQQPAAAAGTSDATSAAAPGAAGKPERGRGNISANILAAHHGEMQAFLSAATSVAGPDVSAWIARELAEQQQGVPHSQSAAAGCRPAMRPTIQTPPTPRKEGCYSTEECLPRSHSSNMFPQQGQQASHPGSAGNARGTWEPARPAGQPRQQQQQDCNAGSWQTPFMAQAAAAAAVAAAAAAAEVPRPPGGWQHSTAADPQSYA